MLSQAYLATKKLLQERPDWGPIITACVQLSEECADGVFWGNAALYRAQQWDPSLVPLRALGILDRVEKGTRNNYTASYCMGDPEGVKQALTESDINPDAKLPGDFFDLHDKRRRAKRLNQH